MDGWRAWLIGAAVGASVTPLAWRLIVHSIGQREPQREVPRRVLVAVGVALVALFALTFVWTERRAEILAVAGLVFACVVLSTIDALIAKLPRDLVWATLAWGLFTRVPVAIRDDDLVHVWRSLAGAVAAAAAVWLLRLVSRGGIGLGDVRLAAVLGWYVAWTSWAALGRAGLVAVVANAVVTAGLLLARRIDRRTRLPFGPALALGALVIILGG